VPRKIDVQYLQANFNDLLAKTESEVTEEEIAKYYDENKDLFIKADTGLLDEVSAVDEAPAANDTPPTENSATETAPANESEAEKTEPSDVDSNEGATEEPGAPTATEDATSTEETPAEEAAPENPPETTPPATPVETPPAKGEGSEQPAPSDADQSMNDGASRRSIFRQVAFLQEQEADSASSEGSPTADEDSAADAESETPAESATTEGAAPAAEGTPPTEPAAASEPAPPPSTETAPAATADPPTSTESADAKSVPAAAPPTDEEAKAADKPDAAEKPPEYQSLDEVRDLVRRDIAYRRANERIGTLMDDVLSELTPEFESYFDRVLSSQSNQSERPAPQAALADLAPLAEKHGLTTGKTGPMTWLEFRETPVGKSTDPNTRFPLSSILYGRTDRELYQPLLTVNTSDGDRYISMKTSDTPSRVPDLADAKVRDQVLRAWKLREAAKIALKDAEKQAAAAEKQGSSLTDFYAQKPAIEVERVDPFSYYTRGDVPDRFDMAQRFRLSQPDGIVAAGPELLDKVFALEQGEVGAALNHDHSIAYVIRVVEHQDSPETLRTAYLAEANTWDGLQAMTEQHVGQSRAAIVANIAGADGIDWKRDPDKLRDDAETEGAAE
jgi:hypothetical protein